MLVTCRLAGLSALETYARVRVGAQCRAVCGAALCTARPFSLRRAADRSTATRRAAVRLDDGENRRRGERGQSDR
jgi:hypothetical protein